MVVRNRGGVGGCSTVVSPGLRGCSIVARAVCGVLVLLVHEQLGWWCVRSVRLSWCLFRYCPSSLVPFVAFLHDGIVSLVPFVAFLHDRIVSVFLCCFSTCPYFGSLCCFSTCPYFVPGSFCSFELLRGVAEGPSLWSWCTTCDGWLFVIEAESVVVRLL